MANRVHRLRVVLVVTLLLLAFAPTVAAADNGCGADSVAPSPVLKDVTPILFVHGIMSSPAMWDKDGRVGEQTVTEYMNAELSKPGAPGGISYTFDWHSKSGYDDGKSPPTLAWVTDSALGPALAGAISCLATKSGRKVVVIAHSMGGLLAKYAVSQSKALGDVSDVFTIDTPLTGAYLARLTVDPNTQTLFSTECQPQGLLRKNLGFLCRLWERKDDVGMKGLHEGAKESEDLPNWPSSIQIHEIAGEITYSLLWPVNANGKSIGDGVVGTNAQVDAVDHKTTHVCSLPSVLEPDMQGAGKEYIDLRNAYDDAVKALEDSLKGMGGSDPGRLGKDALRQAGDLSALMALILNAVAMASSPCFHINMPHNKEVLDGIIQQIGVRPNLKQWNPLTESPSGGQQPGQSPSGGQQPSLLLAAPTDVHVDQFYGVLRWTDNSNNESGFRVYQNGTLIGVENANSTQFHGTAVGSCSDMIVVSAFNATGESRSTPVSYCSSHY